VTVGAGVKMSEKMKERDDGDDDDEVLTMRNDVLLREGPRKEIINNGQREQIANALRPVIDVSVHRLLSRLVTNLHPYLSLSYTHTHTYIHTYIPS